MTLLGKTCEPFASPRAARSARVGYVPPERKRDGLVLGMSIQANISMLVLDRVDRAGFIRRSAERGLAEQWRERLGNRSQSPTQEVSSLSGGNQQKVLLASRLATEPAVLVLERANSRRRRGHTIADSRIRERRGAGRETSSVGDIRRGRGHHWSDRLVIIRDGSIVGELTDGALTQGMFFHSRQGRGAIDQILEGDQECPVRQQPSSRLTERGCSTSGVLHPAGDLLHHRVFPFLRRIECGQHPVERGAACGRHARSVAGLDLRRVRSVSGRGSASRRDRLRLGVQPWVQRPEAIALAVLTGMAIGVANGASIYTPAQSNR